MAKRTISLVLLCAAVSCAQIMDQSQSTGANQPPSKQSNDEMTATGCVGKLNTNFVLMQSDHSYQLEESKKVKLGPYLGQEVEVTGVESPTMSTSSPKASTASPVTITVHSIKSIRKRCSVN
jgi:hypothetical protein